jgi:hypothetical protein
MKNRQPGRQLLANASTGFGTCNVGQDDFFRLWPFCDQQ